MSGTPAEAPSDCGSNVSVPLALPLSERECVSGGAWRVEPHPRRRQTGVSESSPGLGTCGFLREARGTSCSRHLCELPLGPPAHRAAILLTCSLLWVVGPSLLASRAPRLLARRLPSGRDGETRAALQTARLEHLAVVPRWALSLRTCGRSGVDIFQESSRAAAPPRRPASGRLPQVPGDFLRALLDQQVCLWPICSFKFPCL